MAIRVCILVLMAVWFTGKANAATDIGCILECVGESACKLDRVSIPVKSPTKVNACASLIFKEGKGLRGLVDSATGLKRFAANPSDKSIGEQYPALFANARCLSSDPACVQTRESSRVAGIGGKGIDETPARRIGTPCAMGLPCGVVLAQTIPIDFQLVKGPESGVLKLQVLRGKGAQRVLTVSQGRTTLPGGTLAAGAVYAYSLTDAGGVEVAAGEFSVLSTKMQADVESDLQEAKAKAGGELSNFDRIEVLLQNDLGWNAAQIIH